MKFSIRIIRELLNWMNQSWFASCQANRSINSSLSNEMKSFIFLKIFEWLISKLVGFFCLFNFELCRVIARLMFLHLMLWGGIANNNNKMIRLHSCIRLEIKKTWCSGAKDCMQQTNNQTILNTEKCLQINHICRRILLCLFAVFGRAKMFNSFDRTFWGRWSSLLINNRDVVGCHVRLTVSFREWVRVYGEEFCTRSNRINFNLFAKNLHEKATFSFFLDFFDQFETIILNVFYFPSL